MRMLESSWEGEGQSQTIEPPDPNPRVSILLTIKRMLQGSPIYLKVNRKSVL